MWFICFIYRSIYLFIQNYPPPHHPPPLVTARLFSVSVSPTGCFSEALIFPPQSALQGPAFLSHCRSLKKLGHSLLFIKLPKATQEGILLGHIPGCCILCEDRIPTYQQVSLTCLNVCPPLLEPQVCTRQVQQQLGYEISLLPIQASKPQGPDQEGQSRMGRLGLESFETQDP